MARSKSASAKQLPQQVSRGTTSFADCQCIDQNSTHLSFLRKRIATVVAYISR